MGIVAALEAEMWKDTADIDESAKEFKLGRRLDDEPFMSKMASALTQTRDFILSNYDQLSDEITLADGTVQRTLNNDKVRKALE